MRSLGRCVLSLAIALIAVPLLADDLTGSNDILCSAVRTAACLQNGKCAEELPSVVDLPQFVEVDLEGRVLRTTKASGQNLETKLNHVERADGLIMVYGVEEGHTFGWVVNERTGLASGAITLDGEVIVTFSLCTPIEGLGD